MSVFRSLAHLLTELRRTLLAERVTVQFPFAPPDLPPEYRGIIVVADQDACKGCGLCTRDCPALALVLERYDKEQFRLIHYRDRCAYCGQCADNCPSNVIVLSNECQDKIILSTNWCRPRPRGIRSFGCWSRGEGMRPGRQKSCRIKKRDA